MEVNEFGWNLFHRAVYSWHLECMEYLLDNSVSDQVLINFTTEDGLTPLMILAMSPHRRHSNLERQNQLHELISFMRYGKPQYGTCDGKGFNMMFYLTDALDEEKSRQMNK